MFFVSQVELPSRALTPIKMAKVLFRKKKIFALSATYAEVLGASWVQSHLRVRRLYSIRAENLRQNERLSEQHSTKLVN